MYMDICINIYIYIFICIDLKRQMDEWKTSHKDVQKTDAYPKICYWEYWKDWFTGPIWFVIWKRISWKIIESRPRETLKEVLKGVQLDVQVKMTNGFYAHLNKNKGNKVDWKNVTFIDSEKLRKEERWRNPCTSVLRTRQKSWMQSWSWI